MQRFLDVLRALALIAAAVALTGAAGLEGMLYRKLPAILSSANSGAAHFDSFSQTASLAAQDERVSLATQSRELSKAVADAHDLLAHTDISLNGPSAHPGLIPTLTRSISDQNASMLALEAQSTTTIATLNDAAARANAVLTKLDATAGDLQGLAADPDIKALLAQLNADAASGNAVLGQLNAIADSGNRDAQMLEARLREALKPISLAKSIFEHLLGIAPSAVEVGVTLAK